MAVTSPLPQCSNRLNVTAANASDAKRQLNIKARAISRIFNIDTPMFFLKPTSWNDTGYAKAQRMASHFARAPARSSDKNLHWNEEEAHAFAG